MEKFVLAATSHPLEGMSEEFNRCYDEEHLPDLCALPGVVAARRYQASPASLFPCPDEYLALYEIETDDPAGLMREMIRRSQAGEIRRMRGLDQASAKLWLFKQL